MWEEDKEFEISEEIEDYNPEYDNTDVFSILELDSSADIGENEDDFEYDDDFDYDREEQ